MSNNKTIPEKLDKDNPNWNEYSAAPGSWLYQRIEQLYSLTGRMSYDNPEKGIIRDIYNVISRQPPAIKSEPAYTKEMHDRGEPPAIGSVVRWENYAGCEVLINKPDVDNCIVLLMKDEYVFAKLESIKPIPTIEDELFDFLADTTHLEQAERVRQMLEKYNITPRES